VNFVEAVKAGFRNYARFGGRASRSEFWWWLLFAVLVALIVAAMDGTVFEESMLLTLLVWLALLLPSISVGVRRLHDLGRSGWWMMLSFIPAAGAIVLLVFCLQEGDPGGNAYGPPVRSEG
jgi:uncharacterized membrane protein YhaH (DUF805 family)